MSNKQYYWKSVEELEQDSELVESLRQKEFVQEIPVDDFFSKKEKLGHSDTSRRDFLKYIGFSTAAASFVACEGPVVKSIPYVVQPEQIRPGVSDYYATSIADGFDFASVLVKTREGRPIRVMSNKEAPSHNISNARVQASILSLYDSFRFRNPVKKGKEVSWEYVDEEVAKAIQIAKKKDRRVVLLTPTLASPSTYKLISDFSDKVLGVDHIEYDTVSEYAATRAFENVFGVQGLASYDLSKAKTIVSFGADFLGDWQGGGFEAGYSKKRFPSKEGMSKHYQIEANMSLTGANADVRLPLNIAQQKEALLFFVSHLLGRSYDAHLDEKVQLELKDAASLFSKNPLESVLVSGIDDIAVQELVLQVNTHINSNAFNPSKPITTRRANPTVIRQLVDDMNAGNVGVLLMSSVNPVYSLPNSKDFLSGLEKVGFSLTLGLRPDETTK
ncbi:quinol:cytochrome C oxidoreductase, partial [Elysia marginata]